MDFTDFVTKKNKKIKKYPKIKNKNRFITSHEHKILTKTYFIYLF